LRRRARPRPARPRPSSASEPGSGISTRPLRTRNTYRPSTCC